MSKEVTAATYNKEIIDTAYRTLDDVTRFLIQARSQTAPIHEDDVRILRSALDQLIMEIKKQIKLNNILGETIKSLHKKFEKVERLVAHLKDGVRIK